MDNMNQLSKIPTVALLSLLFIVGPLITMASDEVYTGFFSGKAADGYDVVAYFEDGKAVRGSNEYTITYKGVDWYFSSVDHLALFKANPGKYAPQYGGYCAWAVANGYTAKGDPLQWTIRHGKLYLNYNESIKNKWLADVDRLIKKADENWPVVIQ